MDLSMISIEFFYRPGVEACRSSQGRVVSSMRDHPQYDAIELYDQRNFSSQFTLPYAFSFLVD